ncbi:MAG: MATE family efflux transporter [Eubacteriales bacterium]|nr:MATE family efflux transporter [Eubacteriales bacterium]
MNLKTTDMDMLHGSLTGKLLLFTLPIALSSIVQQLFNAADIAVVGYFGKESALAAVGTNTEIIALIVTVSSGLSVGANILIANHIGRNETKETPATVQTAILLAVLAGMIGLLLGQIIAAPLLRLIQTPEGIFEAAELYLRIYMMGYPFLLLYDFGASALRAHGDSRYPFLALIISGIANVALNLFFVIVFHMGVAGVAIATDISTMLSALMVLHRLVKDPMFHFTFHESKFSLRIACEVLKTGIPSAVQGAVFCFANIFVQTSVNGFGEIAIAGSTIAMNFEYFTYYIITAFGQTATTFTSQNYAAGQYRRCTRILWLCLGFSTVCSSVPIFTIVLFRNFFSGLFTTEAAVIESASVRILCILLFEPICNFYEIPAGVLRGLGHALYPAGSTMIGTCAFRIIWIYTVFRFNPTLPMLYHAFPLSWAATILLVNIGFLINDRTRFQFTV